MVDVEEEAETLSLPSEVAAAAKVLKPRKNKWALVDLLDLISLKNLQIKGKNDFNYMHQKFGGLHT